MFSYRHGFHAGNHADVLKHTVLAQVVKHFRLKDAPFWAIDTHAGAGIYDLAGQWANTRGEYADGVARVWLQPDLPAACEPWMLMLQKLNPDSQLRFYPGSPWVWLDDWRAQDRLKLIEQLPAEAEVLRRNLAQRRELPPRSVQVLEQDGFDSLRAMLPPPVRRAIVLMDPSYEDKRDYRRVVESLRDAMLRFPTGCYIVWYPRVSRLQVDQMLRQLRNLAPQAWLDIQLTVRRPPADGHGLFGSGCFLINPPFTLADSMRSAMPWLTKKLALDDTARWSIEQGSDQSKSNRPSNPPSKARPGIRKPRH